jgi:hypothetical protein
VKEGVQLNLGFLCELKKRLIDRSHGSNLGSTHSFCISGESVGLNTDENGGSSEFIECFEREFQILTSFQYLFKLGRRDTRDNAIV